MIQPDLPTSRGRPWGIWGAVSVVLLIGAALLFTGSVQGRDEPLAARATAQPEPPSTPGNAASATPPVAAPPAAPRVERSAPVALRIPAIGVSTPLSGLGLNPDNTVEVPTDHQQAGWFELGPAPGQLGSAVVLGHVDSHRGPAVFFRLRSLRPGDAVEVTLADGAVAHFAVTAVEMYPKERFPAEQVYGPHGISALQLVTCGGEFDPQARSYRSNVVAYTSLVGMTPGR